MLHVTNVTLRAFNVEIRFINGVQALAVTSYVPPSDVRDQDLSFTTFRRHFQGDYVPRVSDLFQVSGFCTVADQAFGTELLIDTDIGGSLEASSSHTFSDAPLFTLVGAVLYTELGGVERCLTLETEKRWDRSLYTRLNVDDIPSHRLTDINKGSIITAIVVFSGRRTLPDGSTRAMVFGCKAFANSTPWVPSEPAGAAIREAPQAELSWLEPPAQADIPLPLSGSSSKRKRAGSMALEPISHDLVRRRID
ncbi:hypothetical protein FRB94_013946 [Tulasnella sp. JGI-2019a]|nr:hypothetical protein FRB93_011197 [Tulasnella sp. JGI-2019a]KAG8989871.1 hypothetical protein FRB94_013946 [Tulasnella sp. JGI-2019a]KAG9021179.1 hypothetical protein FRB95_002698 [Tulasnella sp. JGI-2019a]